MGKAARNRAGRGEGRGGAGAHRAVTGSSGSRRRHVVVEMMEVGHRDGMVTMRMGLEDDEPVRLAVPARQAASLLEGLRAMRLDAEETYWTQIAPGDVAKQRQGVPFPVVLAERRDMLLRSDWGSVLAATPDGGRGLFLVTFAGHVGLCAEPPHVDGWVLAIIDPLQLHRMDQSLNAALAAARAEEQMLADQPILARIRYVHRCLEALRWPYAPPGYANPTREQAEAEMNGRYRDFLARTPYQRPAEHDLPGAAAP